MYLEYFVGPYFVTILLFFLYLCQLFAVQIVTIFFFMLTVPLRFANEPAGRERHQQRLRAETLRLQHSLRALRIH